MTDSATTIHEKAAATAFDKQSGQFDLLYANNTIIQYKRKRVREHVEQFLSPQSGILEINSGTGEDAVYFGRQGHSVHATDISAGMQEVFVNKIREHQLEKAVSSELCSFNELKNLQKQGPYDFIFSNFAGLNCTADLQKVLTSFSPLLKPDGFITLVLLPRFCLWEFSLLFKGKFKTAFRRFSGSKGAKAKIDEKYFRCWYYNPSFIRKQLKKSFNVVALEGLCTLVPPSYIEHFAETYPKLFNFLKRKEDRWKSKWPWNVIGDYYIITLQKK